MTSQRLIIVLSCCLGICLFALGFLLGRESNRAATTVVSTPPVEVVAAAEPVPVAPAAAPSQAPAPIVAPAASPAPTVGSPVVAPANTPPVRIASKSASPAAADDVSDKQAVVRYFRDVDRLQNVDVDDPEAAATSLIGAATSGDTSGLRQLVSQARDTEQKVRAITPPPPCAQYHERLLSLHSESRSMLQRLEQGLGGGDLESLPALLSQANAAKSRSEALANEAREIKRRYGVAP